MKPEKSSSVTAISSPAASSPPAVPSPAPAPSPAPTPSSTPGPRRRPSKVTIAVASLALAAALSGAYWFFFMRGIVYSDDARINGTLVDTAPQIGGTITELAVDEGSTVAAGQLLFKLDSSGLAAALARAQADVSAAQARLDVAKAEYEKALHGPRADEITIALAAKQSADAQAALAASDWQRAQKLYEQKAITDADLLRAKTAWDRATRAQAEAEGRLKLLHEGTRVEDIAAARAGVEAADANLKAAQAAASQAKVNLDYTEVRAPFAGIVARKWRDAGATVSAGTPVFTLLDPSTLYVSANVEEQDLGGIRVGDPVTISVDAYPGKTLKGHVQAILRATNSRFGLIPAEGVSGTFIKVAQRVPLRITLDSTPPGLDLSPGLSVEVHIHVAGEPATTSAVTARD